MIIVSLLNIAYVVCWTVIAIHFDRWYLALFSLLFLTSYKKHWRTNDEEKGGEQE